MSSLPTNKIRQRWIETYFWLNFDANGKMFCKLCCWRSEQNRTVNSSSSKFVQGSKNYHLSSVKYQDASKPHAAAKISKGDFDACKVGFSVPPRKVVQQIPSGSAIAKSMQQMNDKDQETVLHYTRWTSLHTI